MTTETGKPKPKNGPWGRHQSKGKKRPFTEEQVQLIRASLTAKVGYPGLRPRARGDADLRELALLETGLCTCLRASDLLALRVCDVMTANGVVTALPVKQKKTGDVVLVRFGEKSRSALFGWITSAGLGGEARVFGFSRQYYGDIIKSWARLVHADPRAYSTHSLRKSLPAHLYQKTRNGAAAARLLGHKDMAETIAYLNVEVETAHKLAAEFEL